MSGDQPHWGTHSLKSSADMCGQTRIELPFEALLIIAFHHHEKRRDSLGSAVT